MRISNLFLKWPIRRRQRHKKVKSVAAAQLIGGRVLNKLTTRLVIYEKKHWTTLSSIANRADKVWYNYRLEFVKNRTYSLPPSLKLELIAILFLIKCKLKKEPKYSGAMQYHWLYYYW